jgi:hypothetical protein
MSLLAFAMLTTLALVAWFSRAEQPWGWKSAIAMLSAMLGLTTSALMWRAPSRTHAVAGIVVLGLSLVRVGPPSDWTWVSFALIAVTALMLVPLVNAALVLRFYRRTRAAVLRWEPKNRAGCFCGLTAPPNSGRVWRPPRSPCGEGVPLGTPACCDR